MSVDLIKPVIEVQGWNLKAGYRQLPNKLFSEISPSPVKDPEIVIYNKAVENLLGMNSRDSEGAEGTEILSGNEIPKGAQPIAQAYAGHQFGHFTMLGDGRAIILGEQITPKGERYDIQLKGAGPTPYSRRGDGRAALGAMLREYIISEGMYGLGIPSTRSLAVVSTGESILREKQLPGAVLTRIAASHIRVGTFEYISQFGNIEELKALADYTIERHFPNIMEDSLEEARGPEQEIHSQNPKYLKFFEEVMNKQASLIAKWQLAGFIHGVMNTDNMAISGETIDYGPCAFMNTYDPETVFSSIDRGSRYAYKNQPPIAQWNLARFAETLLPLIHKDQTQGVKLIEKHLRQFPALHHKYWLSGMGKKLGIFQASKEDENLIDELLEIMKEESLDFTNTFLALTYGNKEVLEIRESQGFTDWRGKWKRRLGEQTESEEAVKQLMKASNPTVIPRNHQVEKALAAAVDNKDYSVIRELLKVLRNPYDYREEYEPYQKPPGPLDKPYVTYCGT